MELNTKMTKTHYRLKEVLEETGLIVRAEQFFVVKETPQGYWVRSQYIPEWRDFEQLKKAKHIRWISKTSVKRYCYPSIEQAVNSFNVRKKRQQNFVRLKLEELELVVNESSKLNSATAEDLLLGVNLGKTPSHYRYIWDY